MSTYGTGTYGALGGTYGALTPAAPAASVGRLEGTGGTVTVIEGS